MFWIGLETGFLFMHTILFAHVESNLIFEKEQVVTCSWWWWMTVHQMQERNSIKPTKMCSHEIRQWLLRHAGTPIPHIKKGALKKWKNGKKNLSFKEKEERSKEENENENENCTILIPKGNSFCRRKSSASGPRFKVSSEGLSAEIDIPQRSPIQVQTKADVA